MFRSAKVTNGGSKKVLALNIITVKLTMHALVLMDLTPVEDRECLVLNTPLRMISQF